MIPVLLIGALVVLGIAASSKARAVVPMGTDPLTWGPKKPTTTVSVRTPPPAVLRAKRAVLQAKKSPVVKAIEKRLAKGLPGVTPDATRTLKNLLTTALDKKTPAPQKAAAQKQIAAIVAQPAALRTAEINKLPVQAKVELAKAVLANESTKPSADQAAKSLQVWTKGGGNQGSKTNRSQTVKKAQELMGLTADGIIGPETRTRAAALGYPLAPRASQKPGAVGYLLGY
jgi:murein L,D-transpeptidase YcbB/YkuD